MNVPDRRPPARRPPGRPPSARSRLAVLEAALAVLAERGVAAVTVDELATRAGVSKATIYRHWTCKQDICKEAVAALRPEVSAPPTGARTPHALTACAVGLARTLCATQRGHRLSAIAAAASGDPVLGRIWEETLVAPHRRALARVLRRAVRDGEVRRELDIAVASELVVAPILHRLRTHGPDGLERYARRVVKAAWQGLAAR